MMDLQKMLFQARTSPVARFKLNFLLKRFIPFNAPHGIKVKSLDAHFITVYVPKKKRNQNHLKSIHACALATAGEFASGLMMLSKFDPSQLRLIMKDISVDYHYQAKMDCFARCELGDVSALEKKLQSNDTAEHVSRTEILDKEGNHICSVKVTWQLKKWKQVKTQV